MTAGKAPFLLTLRRDQLKQLVDTLGVGADRRSPASMRQALERCSSVSNSDVVRALVARGQAASGCAQSVGFRAERSVSSRAAQPARRPRPAAEASQALDGPFVAIDFETADNGRDSACAVGVVRVERGAIACRVVRLIRPPRRSFLFTYIHGIRWEDVAHEPPFGVVWQDLAPVLDGVSFLVAHNASFDKGVLHACCGSHGITPPPLPFECTVRWARRTWGIYPTNLPAVCQQLRVPLNHHDPGSDAEACARIMIAALAERERAAPSSTKRAAADSAHSASSKVSAGKRE